VLKGTLLDLCDGYVMIPSLIVNVFVVVTKDYSNVVNEECGQIHTRTVTAAEFSAQLKVKVGFLYSAAAYVVTGPVHFTISEVAVDWQEPMVLQRKLRPSNCTC